MLSKRHHRKTTRPKRYVVFKRLFLFFCTRLLLVFRNDDDDAPDSRSKKDDDDDGLLLLLVVVVVVVYYVVYSTRKFELEKTRFWCRDLLRAPRDSTRSTLEEEKNEYKKTKRRPIYLWAKDDDGVVVPRRPSWRPVRRTRLAGRTRARRRPVCTSFLIIVQICVVFFLCVFCSIEKDS